jgi:hypothetical protein
MPSADPCNDVPLSSAEIAGFMHWRGPGAYTVQAERRIRRLVAEAVRREREACAVLLDTNGATCSEESTLRMILETNAAAIRARGAV